MIATLLTLAVLAAPQPTELPETRTAKNLVGDVETAVQKYATNDRIRMDLRGTSLSVRPGDVFEVNGWLTSTADGPVLCSGPLANSTCDDWCEPNGDCEDGVCGHGYVGAVWTFGFDPNVVELLSRPTDPGHFIGHIFTTWEAHNVILHQDGIHNDPWWWTYYGMNAFLQELIYNLHTGEWRTGGWNYVYCLDNPAYCTNTNWPEECRYEEYIDQDGTGSFVQFAGPRIPNCQFAVAPYGEGVKVVTWLFRVKADAPNGATMISLAPGGGIEHLTVYDAHVGGLDVGYAGDDFRLVIDGAASPCPQCDIDGDGDVDLADYAWFQVAFGGPE